MELNSLEGSQLLSQQQSSLNQHSMLNMLSRQLHHYLRQGHMQRGSSRQAEGSRRQPGKKAAAQQQGLYSFLWLHQPSWASARLGHMR